MSSRLATYKQLAQSLAVLFAPTTQVALYDIHDQQICIFNQWTQDTLSLNDSSAIVSVMTLKNQQAKCGRISLEAGYYLQIVTDITLFSDFERFLQLYLHKTQQPTEAINWQQQVDQAIANFAQQQGCTLLGLNAQDKRNLVLALQDLGLLKYQEATRYLASKLAVSRATIYNYLTQAHQLKSVQIHQVDAFTDEPFSGNPAGVVLEADLLNEAIMKKITREMNLSETSFVMASNKADIKLRYFTPSGAEVRFCGHSTVGALYMLAHKKMLGMNVPGHHEFTIEAKVGIVRAAVTNSTERICIQYTTPSVNVSASKISHPQLAKVLGIPLDCIEQTKPVMFEKTNQDLFITIKSLQDLGNLQIDLRAAKAFAEDHNIVAYVLLCNETLAKESDIHMRCFAPAVGIPEDPFTGSVLGGLAAYVLDNGLVSKKTSLRIEQGHFIARPGFVDLELDPNKPHQAPIVKATARHFFSTQISL